jgi:hypothetical protein
MFANGSITLLNASDGFLDLAVRNSLKTRSPIPDWAAEKVKTCKSLEEAL